MALDQEQRSSDTAPDAPDVAPKPAARASAGRIVGADGVRALAALGVIFSHLYQRLFMPGQVDWYQDAQAVFMHGAYGVSTFFVLSGMLLSYPFWKAYLTGAPFPSLRKYARRRAARIVPGYYASLLVSAGLIFLVMPDAPHKLWRLVAGLTFTSGFHYVTFFPSAINGPLWSISLEVFSYVLMPLLLAGIFWLRGLRARRADAGAADARADAGRTEGTPLRALLYWLGAILLVTGLNAVVVATVKLSDEGKGWDYGDIGGAKEWMPGYNPLGFFAHFAIGVLAALLIAMRSTRLAGSPTRGVSAWFDVIALAGLGGAAALIWLGRDPAEPSNQGWFQNQPYQWPFFALLIMTLLVGLAHSRWLGRAFDNRFFRYTATVSFGLYIWHYLLLTLFSEITDGRYQYWGIQSAGQHIAISASLLVIAYAIATVSWKFIEQPALRSKWATRP